MLVCIANYIFDYTCKQVYNIITTNLDPPTLTSTVKDLIYTAKCKVMNLYFIQKQVTTNHQL